MLVRDVNGNIISMEEKHLAVRRPGSGRPGSIRPESILPGSFPDLNLPDLHIPVKLPKQPRLHPHQMPKKPIANSPPRSPPQRKFPNIEKPKDQPNVRFDDANVRFEISK